MLNRELSLFPNYLIPNSNIDNFLIKRYKVYRKMKIEGTFE